jgi:DNA-binding CsgD family transcriptional regulator
MRSSLRPTRKRPCATTTILAGQVAASLPMTTPADQDVVKLGSEMLRFVASIDTLQSPDEILNSLHEIVSAGCKINVLGAGMLPLRWSDYDSVEEGKTVFLHKSIPAGWWQEWLQLNRVHRSPTVGLAWLSLHSFIITEIMTMLEPLGIDRWPFELQRKYGIRDGLICPVGKRWVVAYWSTKVLSQCLSDKARAVLVMGATFAAVRLQKLVGTHTSRIGPGVSLTPREVAVLRLFSVGHQVEESARLLELGEETVRTHLKKAQSKLGVRNRTHAVAQAIRLGLIP